MYTDSLNIKQSVTDLSVLPWSHSQTSALVLLKQAESTADKTEKFGPETSILKPKILKNTSREISVSVTDLSLNLLSFSPTNPALTFCDRIAKD